MPCYELLTESEILNDEILSRTESTHGPSQEMTERGDDDQKHGPNLTETRGRQVSLQFIHFAVARGFDEGQPPAERGKVLEFPAEVRKSA
jgi:hypothetical protein